jgi:hypothetical protein
MRNEAVAAVFFGLIIGLLIAFGVYRLNNSNNSSATPVQEKQTSPTKDSNNKDNKNTPQSLSLVNVENGNIYTEDTINISGIAKESAKIIISTETEDFIVDPATDGTFNKEINLLKGINKITIIALDKDMQIKDTQDFEVVYYPEFEG